MSIERLIQSIDEQISKLQQAKALLGGTSTSTVQSPGTGRRGPRNMSADARRRISLAQKKRWARVKGLKGQKAA